MKRILTIQDVSCVGRCSLTVALPIISAAGVEAAILPTAVLSTHTAFPKWSFCDLTDELPKIGDVFSELGLGFDAIYTGYLGSKRQLAIVSDFIKANPDAEIIIDPVMADNGKLYAGFTEEFAADMASLCASADLIVPNLTEAAFMLGEAYNPDLDEAGIRELLKRLCGLGAKRAALTGVAAKEGEIGYYLYDSTDGSYASYSVEKLPAMFHGTGDVFASCVVGARMRGKSYPDALALAVDFTAECMKRTLADPESRFYGVNFEEALPMLYERLK